MKLRGKIAIVTGGSRGIGETIAAAFVREGALVAICARNQREIARAARGIEAVYGVAPLGVVCDVSDYRAVRRSVRRLAKRFHRLDILVNAAGIQAPIGPFAENRMDDWEKNVAVNLFGTANACHAAIPFMAAQRSGAIINFSGGGATSSRPNFSAYAAAKTGIVKFTEILSDELKPYHIRVNAIAPGAVNTAMLREVLSAGRRAGKKEFDAVRERAKKGGVSPELAAALAVFLASTASGDLSGRLVSAVWDDWARWDQKIIDGIMAGDALTLRRTRI